MVERKAEHKSRKAAFKSSTNKRPECSEIMTAGGLLIVEALIMLIFNYEWYLLNALVVGLLSLAAATCSRGLQIFVCIVGIAIAGLEAYRRIDHMLWYPTDFFDSRALFYVVEGLALACAFFAAAFYAAALGSLVAARSVGEPSDQAVPPVSSEPGRLAAAVPVYADLPYTPQPVASPRLQPAQLIPYPGAAPQPILITGMPPPPGQAGYLHPVGEAYVAYPPQNSREQVPVQPLTGQPILLGPPNMYAPTSPRNLPV